MSGLSAEDALAMGAARALAKPVKRSEVVRAVAELIGPPGTSNTITAHRIVSRMAARAENAAGSRLTLRRALVGLGVLLVVINVGAAVWDARAERGRTETLPSATSGT